MNLTDFPFSIVKWDSLVKTEHAGVTGSANWYTRNLNDIRVRMVEYTPGYLADHWCSKGHILLVLEGELITELKDGREFLLTRGMSYLISDNSEPHRSRTETGVKLFIVD